MTKVRIVFMYERLSAPLQWYLAEGKGTTEHREDAYLYDAEHAAALVAGYTSAVIVPDGIDREAEDVIIAAHRAFVIDPLSTT